MNSKHENMHAIMVKYHGPTNTRGSRVSLYSERFKDRISEAFDYSSRDISEQAVKMLQARGFTVLGIAEVRTGYVILSDTFRALRSTTQGERHKAFPKWYECRKCHNRVVLVTNHYLDAYPTCEGKCKQYTRTGSGTSEQEHVLPEQTAHKFISEID